MVQITLQAKSSEGSFYDVMFSFEDKSLKVRCSCRAGIFGQLCKHKIKFISGDTSLLYDNNQFDEFNRLQELIKKSNLPKLTSQLDSIRLVIEQNKMEEKRIKNLIENELK